MSTGGTVGVIPRLQCEEGCNSKLMFGNVHIQPSQRCAEYPHFSNNERISYHSGSKRRVRRETMGVGRAGLAHSHRYWNPQNVNAKTRNVH